MNLARETDLMQASLAPLLAGELGLDLVSQAATGSVQATASLINSNFVNVTSSSAGTQDGITIQLTKGNISGMFRFYVIFNSSANTINVYPRSGGTIDAGAANVAATIPTGKSRIFYPLTQANWISILSN